MNESKYMEFLKSKMAIAKDTGFEIDREKLNSALMEHQKDIVQWALKDATCSCTFALYSLIS